MRIDKCQFPCLSFSFLSQICFGHQVLYTLLTKAALHNFNLVIAVLPCLLQRQQLFCIGQKAFDPHFSSLLDIQVDLSRLGCSIISFSCGFRVSVRNSFILHIFLSFHLSSSFILQQCSDSRLRLCVCNFASDKVKPMLVATTHTAVYLSSLAKEDPAQAAPHAPGKELQFFRLQGFTRMAYSPRLWLMAIGQ